MSKPPRTGRSLADLIGPTPEEQPAPTVDSIRPHIALDGKSRRVEEIARAVDEGGKPKTFFVTPADNKRLKQVELDTEMSFHEMAREALSEWLERRGLRPLEPQSANRQTTGRKRE